MLIKFTAYRQTIKLLIDKYLINMKDGRPYTCTIVPWYKPKTTGKDSQLNHIWGHATQIGNHVGSSAREVIDQARWDALSKGYSTKKNFRGRVVPVRISEANTMDASYVITQLHEYADFIPLKLIEEYEA